MEKKPTAAPAKAKPVPKAVVAKPTAPVKAAPAKPAVKPTAPAKPNGISTVVGQATAKPAAPVKAKPVATKAPAKAKLPDDAKFTVADDSGVKRGMIREYVDQAKKFKTFTRPQMTEHFKAQWAEEICNRHFYWCTGHGIFAAA
jgi:uncharacterized membrane-anchored protein